MNRSSTQQTPAPRLIGTAGDSLREAFGKHLAQLCAQLPELVVLDADVAGGTGTHHVRSQTPQQFIQCGIAEQNMVSVAAGLALTGHVPVVATFAVFALRGIEQARLSIALPKLNVKVVASHPGLDTGPDGASAQALEDMAAWRASGMTVLSPADPLEMELATEAMLAHRGPVYMRSGRSPAQRIFRDDHQFEIGKGQILHPGRDVTLVGCGVETARCLEAARLLSAESIQARVVNMPSIKPIDSELIERCALETGAMVTAEDHNVHGGLAGAVAEALVSTRPCPLERVGVWERFGESGEPTELSEYYGLDGVGIAKAAKQVLQRKS